MKRFLLVLCLIPSLVLGAYTEWYCTNGGSNLNSGSTSSNSATYSSAGGNWVQATRVFTPTDGSTPASSISVGDYASVYVTAGATVAAFIGRVTAIGAGVNGTITLSGTNQAGSAPANGTGTITLKVGGAWKGMAGAVLFPFTLSFGNLVNTNSDPVRINLKNDQTYSISSTLAPSGSGQFMTISGYSSSPGDGGRATIDGGTNTFSSTQIIAPVTGGMLQDLIITSTATTGITEGIGGSAQGVYCVRVTVTGMRSSGFAPGNSAWYFYESEANNCNKSNSAGKAGFQMSTNSLAVRCISSGNTGSNTDGFLLNDSTGFCFLSQNVSFGNGRHGYSFNAAGVTSPYYFLNCDAYNNGGDALKNRSTTTSAFTIVENFNAVKSTGYGINSALTTGKWFGFIYNAGYPASGTTSNGSGNTNGLDNVNVGGTVTYTANTTPWIDPANGNFKINNTQAFGAGRGNFVETQGGFSGTVGYPDIGAAQHNDTCGGLGPCQTSGASSY